MNAPLLQTILEAVAHARADKHVDAVERVRLPWRRFMKRLVDRQFEQGFANNLPLADFINPELATLAGMLGDGFPILTAHGHPEHFAAVFQPGMLA